jgi:ADP-ribose pyrophosphatase
LAAFALFLSPTNRRRRKIESPYKPVEKYMLQMIGRVGKAPERLVYSGFRVERKGFLSILTYVIEGFTHRFDLLERGQAAVVLPVDFRTRELYMLSEIRPNKPFGAIESGRAWIRKVMQDGFTQPAEAFEIASDEARVFELCAGMIDVDKKTGEPLESPEDAAVRELREETGLVVEVDRLIHVASYMPSVGGSSEMIHAYIADLAVDHAESRQDPLGDGGEEMDVYKMSWDDAFELMRTGRIETASTGLLLRELRIRELEKR